MRELAVLRAAGFFAAGFFAAGFFAAGFFAAGFFAAGFFAASFLAALDAVLPLLDAVLRAAGLRAAGFLAAVRALLTLARRVGDGVAAGLEASPPRSSSEATRLASACTSSRSPSSVPTRFASRIPRSCVEMSSSRSCARSRVAVAPPDAPAKVRSTASRRVSVGPLDPFFFLPFSVFLAMVGDSIPEPIHLRPHAPVAERVILPGDPGRALRLAQLLSAAPKMLNHHRGLWGYSGEAADGSGPLTIQATGMGGPSAAIVVEELGMLGARRLVRAGTCGAIADLGLGTLVAVTDAVADDGASRALGIAGPDTALTERIPAAVRGAVVTRDLFYDDAPFPDGVLAVEMECAAVFAAAARRDIAAAAVLCVSDRIFPERVRITEEALHEAEHHLGRAALAALA